MWIYWLLFLWPAIATFSDGRDIRVSPKPSWMLYSVFMTLIIGLRFEVGVDWWTYLIHLDNVVGLTWLESAQQSKDPAYGLLNWLAASTGSGVWVTNLSCAIIFVSGLLMFCRRLPNAWLAVSVAVPYIGVVMAMNYTRQGAAFGLVLWALVALHEQRILRFVCFLILAGLFHKTAILLIPLGAVVVTQHRALTIVWVIVAAIVTFFVMIAEVQQGLYEQYIVGRMDSDGAWIRVMMNAAPACIFLVLRKRFDFPPSKNTLYMWLSVIALLFIPAMILSPSTTVVDRIALYFMPLQLVIYAYLPLVLQPAGLRIPVALFVVCGYALVLFVWLNYSNFHDSWIPYRFYPLEVP